jgi:RNA polymerase sigma-70 factor (ECF subfamily)
MEGTMQGSQRGGSQTVTLLPAVGSEHPALASAVPDDVSLLLAVAGGAPTALEALYERHARGAYALACWMVGDPGVAEDVVQEAFLTIWRQATHFDPARGSAHAWIVSIVRHRAIDTLRRRRSQRVDEHAVVPEGLSDTRIDVEGAATLNVESARLRAAMLALPPEQRRALELAYFGGLTHHEIATHLGLPLGTIKGRLRLALRRLHLLLAGERAATVAS